MTDQTQPGSAERIQRLQERRAASSGTGTTKQRRKHPAAASRILLAGLSVTSFFGLVGAMSATHVATTAAVVEPAQSRTTSPAATPAKHTATPVAHTQTRGS